MRPIYLGLIKMSNFEYLPFSNIGYSLIYISVHILSSDSE